MNETDAIAADHADHGAAYAAEREWQETYLVGAVTRPAAGSFWRRMK